MNLQHTLLKMFVTFEKKRAAEENIMLLTAAVELYDLQCEFFQRENEATIIELRSRSLVYQEVERKISLYLR